MAVTVITSKTKFMGATADTKPTFATHNTLPGATFYDYQTGILYITYDGTNWVEKDTIVRLEAGLAVAGKVGLVDSGGSTALDKTEDAAHSSGDKGIMTLGVRSDAGTGLVSADGDYASSTYDRFNGLRTGRPIFGEPSLAAVNNSSANWAQGLTSPLDQKSPTGWLACLYGGLQTGDDWARVNVPVDELLLTKFTGTSEWTYWMTNAESMGVGIVLWVHDPTNLSKRADISQMASVSGVGKAAGWNRHQLNPATTQFVWYGENITGSALTSGTQYTLNQFIADVVFSTYTVYRITIEYGWDASGTLEDAFVADLILNGIPILLKPDSGGSGRISDRFYTTAAASFAATLAPKTPFRLLNMLIHTSGVLATGENFTADVDAGRGTAYDTNIYTDDLFIGSRTSVVVPFGVGYDFRADDEIDFANANGGTDTIGLTVTYQTVFP